MSQTLRIAVFPGAANAPLYLALERGWLVEAGLDVTVVEVRSSDEQMRLWASGEIDVMQTSPDHLLRERRARDPVIVRRDGFGELSVYRREASGDLEPVAWAVDGLDSGFAFVLRALLEDVCGLPRDHQRIVAVGGTKQRFDALMEGDGPIGGTTLHPPFDSLAGRAGCVRLVGHLERFPDLSPLVTIVPRATVGTAPVSTYLHGMDRAVAELVEGGEQAVAGLLERHGLPAAVAAAGAAGMLGAGGLGVDRTPDLRGLEVAARLRRRFSPAWELPVSLDRLLAPGAGTGMA